MRRFTSIGIAMMFILVPTGVSADVLSDLQAMQLQVQQLINELARLQSAQRTGQQVTSAVPATAGSSSSCVNLSFNMGPDDTDATTNGEVTRLQQWLASQGPSLYPEARITGYFGPATMRAVQRWQARQGIVSSGDPDSTGYGYVGPRTRMTMSCGSTNTQPVTSGSEVQTVFDPTIGLSIDMPADTSYANNLYTVPNDNPSKYVKGLINFDTREDASSIASCEQVPAGVSPSSIERVSIQGETFLKYLVRASSPGEEVETFTYRKAKYGRCYIVTQKITISDTITYDPRVSIWRVGARPEVIADYDRIKAAQDKKIQSIRLYDVSGTSSTGSTLTLNLAQQNSLAEPEIHAAISQFPVLIGEPVTISWFTENATSCTLLNGTSLEPIALSGSKTMRFYVPTALYFNCINQPVAGGPSKSMKPATLVIHPGSLPSSGNAASPASSVVPAGTTPRIDQTSVTSTNNSFTLSGRATGSSVFVALVPASYSGPRDWATLYYNRQYTASSGDSITSVSGGVWSTQFRGVPPGSYTVLLYNNDSGAQNLLAAQSLVVNAPTSISFAPNGSSIEVGVGQTATDGAVSIRINSVTYSEGLHGIPTANLTVSPAGYAPSTYSVTAGETVGNFVDSMSPGGGIIIRVISVSVNMRAVLLQIVPQQLG